MHTRRTHVRVRPDRANPLPRPSWDPDATRIRHQPDLEAHGPSRRSPTVPMRPNSPRPLTRNHPARTKAPSRTGCTTASHLAQGARRRATSQRSAVSRDGPPTARASARSQCDHGSGGHCSSAKALEPGTLAAAAGAMAAFLTSRSRCRRRRTRPLGSARDLWWNQAPHAGQGVCTGQTRRAAAVAAGMAYRSSPTTWVSSPSKRKPMRSGSLRMFQSGAMSLAYRSK